MLLAVRLPFKKLSISFAIVTTWAGLVALAFFQVCETLDREIIAPQVATNLEELNYEIVNDTYCSSPTGDDILPLVCELRKLTDVNGATIKKLFGDKREFKTLIKDVNYEADGSKDSRFIWYMSLLAVDAYDAYALEYSDQYVEDWEYSWFNVFENYRMFAARFTTAIFTFQYVQDWVIPRDNRLLVISNFENKYLIVRDIYEDVQDSYIFSL